MKKILLSIAVFSTFIACQDELYNDDLKEHRAGQAVYIDGGKSLTVTIADNANYTVRDFSVKLVKPSNGGETATLVTGDAAQLEAYNTANGTSYELLPTSMYEVNKTVTFNAQDAVGNVSLQLKNVQFPLGKSFALPVKLQGNGISAVAGQDTFMILVEQQLVTKSLRINGSGPEVTKVFPLDHEVDQWTLEVMVNRSAYTQNNQAIVGTKAEGEPLNEIFTRFGDVTIDPNQLQIKTGASQIDVPKDKFAAQPNKWYMLGFSYDGKTTRVFVNGVEVASREIRTGKYSVTGFWLSGRNQLIREVRFWKRAVPAAEIAKNTWKTIDPKSDGLLFYYPMNGKKYDQATGAITDDETKIWDWSSTGANLDMPSSATFDNNNGSGFVFPPAED
ncbi:hypothetical protein RCZ04_20630 [Capnocytophaga sp. HP1101]